MGTVGTKEEQFYESCGYGATPKVKQFIDEGINVNYVSLNVSLNTILHCFFIILEVLKSI